jgi:adenosyl cobinamide kinase/adenosyl cobinamide phosphate guanylyltransferase
MPLILLLGGARSGKSDLAVRLAAVQPAPVVMIATAEAYDDEMARRIERHQAERPPAWETVEAPIELEQAIDDAPPEYCLIIDDLTLWVANLLGEHGEEEIEALGSQAAWAAAARDGMTITVSNEVGLGLVPDNALGRRYRDLLGRVNASWAQAADESYLLVAGRMLPLHGTDELLNRLWP